MAWVVTNKKQFGKALREARLERGLSQEDLGKQCGVTGMNISRMETGQSGPGQHTFNKLIQALNLPKRKFTQWAKGEGEAMDATGKQVEALRGDIAGLTEAIKGMIAQGGQSPVSAGVPETGSKAQFVKALDNVEKRVEELEKRAANPVPVVDEIETQESPVKDLDFEEALSEFEGAGKEIGFFEDLFDAEEKVTLKKKVQDNSIMLCEQLELDPNEEVENGLFDSTTRAEKVADVFYDFACEKISKKEAAKALKDLLGGEASPDDEKDEDEESWG